MLQCRDHALSRAQPMIFRSFEHQYQTPFDSTVLPRLYFLCSIPQLTAPFLIFHVAHQLDLFSSQPFPLTNMPPAAPMDPAVLTRQEWTDTMLSWTCPAGADESYAKLWSDLLYLCDLLGNHPAMVENNKQTYNTPATSKNKVYFM